MPLPKSTLEHWAVLAEVVEQGGFAQAAKALNRSQSAVSYAIARLQESLNVPVLTIVGRRAELTAHGAVLLQRARGLIAQLNTLEQLAGSLQRGWEAQLMLVVDAAYPRARLLRIVAQLQKSCPATQLQVADVVLSGAEEAILAPSADIVVTSRVPPGFLGDRVLEVDFIAAAHPQHALFALRRRLTVEDLQLHVQAVIRDSGAQNPRDDGWLGSPLRFTVSSMEASLATLLAGLAYAWLPQHLLQDYLRAGTLKKLPLQSGGTRRVSLHIVATQLESLGPAAQAALAAFKQ